VEQVQAEGREAEGRASEGARAYGGGLGGLSGADHQVPAGERPAPGVVGVGSGGEAAVAALLKTRQTRFWGGLGVAARLAPHQLKAGALFRAC
jgi:hypothetical protein